MTSKASNPALLAAAAGLGDVYHSQAIDYRDIPETLREIQYEHVRRRTRLRPTLARVIVDLAFGGAHECGS